MRFCVVLLMRLKFPLKIGEVNVWLEEADDRGRVANRYLDVGFLHYKRALKSRISFCKNAADGVVMNP